MGLGAKNPYVMEFSSNAQRDKSTSLVCAQAIIYAKTEVYVEF